MFRSIIPREQVFFDNFEKICEFMTAAAEALQAMFENGAPYTEAAHRIKSLESQADEVTHHSIEKLHKTFVTPIDRQDILRLVVGLDDILDTTEAVAARLNLYQPRHRVPEAQRLASLVVRGAEKAAEMVGLLRQPAKAADRLLALSLDLNQIEHEADRAYHEAIARLFREENDPKELIKWKDLLELMESATDRCEDVGDIIEGIVLENA
jgi:predicted phosphate transport protein (TIGR00153 family)